MTKATTLVLMVSFQVACIGPTRMSVPLDFTAAKTMAVAEVTTDVQDESSPNLQFAWTHFTGRSFVQPTVSQH